MAITEFIRFMINSYRGLPPPSPLLRGLGALLFPPDELPELPLLLAALLFCWLLQLSDCCWVILVPKKPPPELLPELEEDSDLVEADSDLVELLLPLVLLVL